MKKRILALLLCVIFLLPVLLTSCTDPDGPGDGTDTTEEEEEVAVPASLNFYIITEDDTTESARAAMEDAFNVRSKELYRTEVNFIFCTAAEYEQTVTNKLEAIKAANRADPSLPSAADQYADYVPETKLDEWNLPVEIYPGVADNQVDILLITGKEMYDNFKSAGYLADLTDYLNGENAAIKSHVNSNLLNGAKDNDRFFAVPNNVLIGHYTYMLVDKELAGSVYYDEGNFMKDGNVDYDVCRDFLTSISGSKDLICNKLGISDFYPLKSYFDYPTVEFFPYQENQDTFFGVVYRPTDTYMTFVELVNVFDHQTYRSYYSLMIHSKGEGYAPADLSLVPSDMRYGIQVVEGTYADRARYADDYYCYTLDSPRLSDDDAFGAMFAVSRYSASVERSMEIIQDLLVNPDAELRNILQYGVEKVHYTVEDGLVTRITNDQNDIYHMNINYTGNVSMVLPNTNDNMAKDFSESLRLQNTDATRNPVYGLTATKVWNETKLKMIETEQIRLIKKAMQAEYTTLQTKYPSGNKDLAPVLASGKISDYEAQWQIYVTLAGNPKYEDSGEIDDNGKPIMELVIPSESVNAVSESIKTLKAQATTTCETFISEALAIVQGYMDQIKACTTVAQFEAVYATMNREIGTKNDNNAPYFINSHAGEWVGKSDKPFGLLVTTYESAPCRSTLAGYVDYWYKVITNAIVPD